MTISPLTMQFCPQCGSARLITEPAIDADGSRTGSMTVVCDGCGYELGELGELAADQEAPPDAEQWVRLPDPDVDD
jgi:hypothetical protein